MSATQTVPKPKSKQDKAPAKLEVDQCPVCHTPEAQVRLYVSTASIDYIRRVWACLSCGHEWKREPEDTARKAGIDV